MKAREGLPFPDSREDAPSGSAATENKLDMPRISIVTPSFNQGEFIERTIQSVISQEYPNLEYIVMDGGSTDGSVSVLERYSDHLDHWESRSDEGQSDAINRGFRKATGDILAWVNSDDLLAPGALDASAAALTSSPKSAFSYGDWTTIDADSRVVQRHKSTAITNKGLLERLQSYVAQPTIFFRKFGIEEVGLLDPDLHLIMDFDLLLRLTARFDGCKAQGQIALFRLHDEAKTPTLREQAWMERGRVLNRFLGSDREPAVDNDRKRKIMAAYHRQAALYGLRSRRFLWLMEHALRSFIYHPGQIAAPRLWNSAFRSRSD